MDWWDEQFIISVIDGNLNMVKQSIENGVNIHVEDDLALRLSAKHGHLKIVRYLVEHGADINARNSDALISSAQNGHLDVVQYLIEHNANIHARNNRALKKSVQNNHLDVAHYLLENGANPDAIPIERLRDIKSRYGHYDLAMLSHKKMIDEGIEPVLGEDISKFVWDKTEPTSRSLKGRIIRLLKEDLSSKDRSILLSLL